MKTRFGFVSNSSSSSFVINTKLTPDQFKQFLSNYDLSIGSSLLQTNWYGFACVSGWTTIWNDEQSVGDDLIKVLEKLKEVHGDNSYMIDVFSE